MRSILMALFMLLFLGIIVLSVVYLSRRMHFFFATEGIRYWYILFSSVPVLMIAGLALFSNSKLLLGSLVYQFAAVIMGFMLYFLLTVLVLDLVWLFVKSGALYFGIASFAITALIMLAGIIHAFRIQVSRHEVPMPGLTKEIRAVHLSDIHIGHFRGNAFFNKVISKSMAEDPQIIFITGDLFDGRIRLSEEILKPLEGLTLPVFFVEGNHDGYTGVRLIKDLLRDAGVRVLDNEVEIHEGIQVVGLKHMHADSSRRNFHANGKGSIKGALDRLDIRKDLPAVLLHHSPEGAKYADAHGIDLYLSGHTHGGQLFPLTLINEIIFPFNRGMNRQGNTRVFVSEGVGTFGPPMRIGTKSEIVVLDLLPENP